MYHHITPQLLKLVTVLQTSVSFFFQVNHMHHMEVGDDNLSFAIWTGSDPDAEIFTMTVSSAEKKRDWLLALQKLQESQISFAMGKLHLVI